MEVEAVSRLVAERELHTSKTLELKAADCFIIFTISSLTADDKQRVKRAYDDSFPVPPVIAVQTPVGSAARFDLENPDYQKQLTRWHESLSYGVLAATLGMTAEEVHDLEHCIPCDFMGQLFSTAELINGIQSEPLADLIKEAIWAPEVLAWIATYQSKGDEVQITDKPLFRQMEAMIAAGLTFKQWDDLTPRERILIMNWFEYKNVREGYVNWWSLEKNKPVQSQNPLRATLG